MVLGDFFSESNKKKLTSNDTCEEKVEGINKLFYSVPFSILGIFSIVFTLTFTKRSTGIGALQSLVHTSLY